MLTKLIHGYESLSVGDGEHTQEPFPRSEVAITDNGIVFLPCGVKDINLTFLAIDNRLLAIIVCLCGFVVFYKLEGEREKERVREKKKERREIKGRREVDRQKKRQTEGVRVLVFPTLQITPYLIIHEL